jgi:hypothetical protein
VDLSGIIFVVLAIAWAVYLIPKALKTHDEVARSRPVDGTDARRVLARREPVGRSESRLVVPTAAAAPAPRQPRPAERRTAAKVAARRRRRVLLVLIACLAGTVAAATVGRLPWVSLAAPAGVVVVWLVLCRTQVRRERRRPLAARTATAVPVEEPPVEEARVEEVELPVDEHGVVDLDRAEDTFGIPVAQLQAALAEPTVEAAAQHDSGLWDPLPVTLPTYVTKPKARRTVRTIDLGEPGTWTSGHTAEDTETAAGATETPDVRTGVADGRRVVGG